MSARFLFIAAIAFGAYVLGARAGRERYDEIKNSVTKFWEDPTVKKTRRGITRRASHEVSKTRR